MTWTAAIAQFGNRILAVGVLVLLVRTRFIIPGVATRTVGGITCVTPGHHLTVACMATSTSQVGTVIPRITSRVMAIDQGRQPTGSAVTAITLLRGLEMTGVLALCLIAVVAGGTTAGNRVVIEAHRSPGSLRKVTAIASRRGLDVTTVLTGGGGAVVAALASPRDASVIETHCGPVRL